MPNENKIHIKKHVDGWQGLREGKDRPIFVAATKAQAIKQGLAIAMREKGALIVCTQNGNEIQKEFTFRM